MTVGQDNKVNTYAMVKRKAPLFSNLHAYISESHLISLSNLNFTETNTIKNYPNIENDL